MVRDLVERPPFRAELIREHVFLDGKVFQEQTADVLERDVTVNVMFEDHEPLVLLGTCSHFKRGKITRPEFQFINFTNVSSLTRLHVTGHLFI